jgi:hypothetical protein
MNPNCTYVKTLMREGDNFSASGDISLGIAGAAPEASTLTHHEHEISKSKMDSFFLVILHLSGLK